MTNQAKPRLAVIGCGAVVQEFYGPALKQISWRPKLMVDRDLERARGLLRSFKAEAAAETIDGHVDEIDVAIVAVPNMFHTAFCTLLLEKGIHVLVEKPMATTTEEARAMIVADNASSARLAVGLARRFLHVANWTKALLENSVLGEIQSFDLREGTIFDWPATTDSFWRKESAGGGVLIDIGVHVLDLLLWWLGDVERVQSYMDDSYGGVETDSLLELTLKSGAKGVVELSKMRNLRNTAIIRGSRGWVEVGLMKNEVVGGSEEALGFRFNGMGPRQMPQQLYRELLVPELQDWLSSIQENQQPKVTGIEAARSVELIEQCYRQRCLWKLPWVQNQ